VQYRHAVASEISESLSS